MKNTLFFLCFLTFSLVSNAQKKKQAEQSKIVSNQAIKINPKTETDFDVQPYKASISVDSVRISAGKKYVFLASVNPDNYYQNEKNIDLDIENWELKNNFPEKTFEIIIIKRYTIVIFENGKTLEINNSDQKYQAVAYWSGNLPDLPVVQNGLQLATEFVAKQLGENKESSYIVGTRNARNEIEKYKRTKKYTKSSKKLQEAFFKTQMLVVEGMKGESLLSNKTEQIKTCNIYFSKNSENKYLYRSFVFDTKGNLINMKQFNSSGAETHQINYKYINEILTGFYSDRENTVMFCDNKMIINQSDDTNEKYLIITLQNNELIYNNYVIAKNEDYTNTNLFDNYSFENNCIVRVINNVITTKICKTNPNVFPITNTFISYQDKKELPANKTIIYKRNEKTYEEFYFFAESENEMLGGIYTLNHKNLLETIKINMGNTFDVFDIEYTYN